MSTWTITELTERVTDALAASDDPSQERANGRVREVPDARTIRWYQTTGLLDRPAMRGRTALYDRRHLLQLLAIKRLQSQGWSLARIQARLAGAPDRVLARVAGGGAQPGEERRDEQRPDERAATDAANPGRARFWAAAPAPPARVPQAVHGVRLEDGVRLILDDPARPLDAGDLHALADAARPLVEELRRRGLARDPDADSNTGENS